MSEKKKEPEKEKEKEEAAGSVASWKESIHINRGQRADSDEIQEVVRHHRKETERDEHPDKNVDLKPENLQKKTEAA